MSILQQHNAGMVAALSADFFNRQHSVVVATGEYIVPNVVAAVPGAAPDEGVGCTIIYDNAGVYRIYFYTSGGWQYVQAGPGGAAAHNILSATHGDSVAAAVVRGDLIYGNATPAWQRLAHPGAANRVLQTTAADVQWSAWALVGTAGQTYTFPAVGGTVTLGTGVANQVAYWSGVNTVVGDVGLTYDAANDILTITPAALGGLTFAGATATNRVRVPDNVANALYLDDAGGIEYLRVVSTDAQPELVVNDGGVNVDLRFETPNYANAYFLNAGTDRHGFGINNPDAFMEIDPGITADVVLRVRGVTSITRGIVLAPETTSNSNGLGAIEIEGTVTPGAAVAIAYGTIARGVVDGGQNITVFYASSWRADLAATYTGTVTSAFDARFANPMVSGGTLLSAYGIRVDNITAGSVNNFAIETLGGQVVFNQLGDSVSFFRVESNNYTHMLYVDVANDRIGVNASVPATLVELAEVETLTGNLGDGYAACLTLDTGYTGAFTVTRHNYIDVNDASTAGGAAVTDGALFRFDAAIGTHCVLAASFNTTDSNGDTTTWDGGIIVNVNGTLKQVPLASYP